MCIRDSITYDNKMSREIHVRISADNKYFCFGQCPEVNKCKQKANELGKRVGLSNGERKILLRIYGARKDGDTC